MIAVDCELRLPSRLSQSAQKDLGAVGGRKDLNHPPTAVGGIPEI